MTVKTFHHDTKIHAEEIARAYNLLERRFDEFMILYNKHQAGVAAYNLPSLTSTASGTVS